MNDTHGRFAEWVAQGAPGEPPRDAAVHAFVCSGCQDLIAAFDTLAAVDPGRATLPPSRAVDADGRGPSILAVARVAGSAAAIVAVAVGISFGASRLLASQPPQGVGAPPPAASETPVQAVLGGQGSPAGGVDSTPSPSLTDAPAATVSASPSATEAGVDQWPQPTAAPRTKRPDPTATAAPRTPAPTARASATSSATAIATASPSPSSSPSPSATSTPTVAPTPSPTPPPTPSPTPPSSDSQTSSPAASPSSAE